MKTCIPVTKFQTFDGKIFESEKKANEHIEDLIQEKLDSILNPLIAQNLLRGNIVKIISTLTEKENLHIFSEIAKMLEYGEE